MGLSNNISSYLDIRRVLDAARQYGGALYRPRDAHGNYTHGAATNWILRANKFRLILREQAPLGNSSFDDMVWTRQCQCRTAADCVAPGACGGNVVVIAIGSPIRGELETFDGDPITLTADLPEVDEALAEAIAARRELGLDEE